MIPALLRLLAAAAVVALLVYWLRGSKRSQPSESRSQPTPEDTPDLVASLQEFYQQQDRELELAKYWSDDEVALAIEAYVFKLQHSSDDHDDLFRKLLQQPETTARLVLQVVTDPNLQARLRKEPRGEPAIYRACQLLMQQPTRAAIPYVQRLLTAQDESVQQAARRWLAQLDGGGHQDSKQGH